MSTISAGNTLTTGFVQSSDTTGNLVLSATGNIVLSAAGNISLGTTNTGLILNSTGQITMPQNPAFMAGIASTSDASVSVGNYVPFNTVTGGLNRGSCFNTSTYLFTAPIAGIYYFFFNLYMTNSSSSTQAMQAGLYVNGTIKSFTGGDAYGVSTGQPNAFASGTQEFTGGSAIYQLSAGDTVGVQPRTNTLRIYQGHTNFGGYLIG